jgi:NAD(P)-dependent dehydrogenase (short-subunit alcohol dehydrogenase family)
MASEMARLNRSKAVLITGCASGIGKVTAQHLAAQGWTVYATSRDGRGLDALTAAGCHPLPLDVNDEASMAAAVAAVTAREGAVGVLINNAGYSQSGAVEAVPMAKVRAQFETNVFGPVRLTQLVLPGMRAQRWGKVVNLSSMGGKLTFPGGGYYHATKHAVEAISDALRFEVRGFGVDVVVIEPGLIRTGFSAAATSQMNIPPVGPDDPYGAFHAHVAKATVESYERGPLAKLAGEALDVAKAITKAITVDKPRARDTVSGSARLLLGQRTLLSDSAWDRFLRGSFPSPGASSP